MYSVAPYRSAAVGESAAVFLFSSAQVAFAPSICFMLAMQAFFWLAVRALTKLGIAIAANKPMMATTIMISTSVKPERRIVVIFILLLPFSSGVNDIKGGFSTSSFVVHLLHFMGRDCL